MADGVAYAEVRCSPANYADPRRGRSAWDMLVDIRNTFQLAMQDAAHQATHCHVNLLLIATREEGGDRSRIARHLALAVTAAEHWREGCRVVGVDLAGFEHRETRAALTENLRLAARLYPGLRRLDVLQLQANAARTAFISPVERQHLLGRISRVPHPLVPLAAVGAEQ